MNRLFVAYKPAGIGSNKLLGRLKRKYGVKKAGFSGTLDPFAKGVLIVAFGNHTKLFRFLKKTPKHYRATLWLGAHSDTLDIEGVTQIDTTMPLDTQKVTRAIERLKGEQRYYPPKYSAKKIAGKRAYTLARNGEDVALKMITSYIFASKLLHYNHPFITFEVSVSEGSYIRSLGKLVAENLGIENSALSSLERLSEGKFRYNNEKALDITDCLDMEQNNYLGDIAMFQDGKKLAIDDFTCKENGIYFVDLYDFIAVIEIKEQEVHYLLNKVAKC